MNPAELKYEYELFLKKHNKTDLAISRLINLITNFIYAYQSTNE